MSNAHFLSMNHKPTFKTAKSSGQVDAALSIDHRKLYAEIIDETEAYLLRAALRLTAGNDDKAQDLVQEAFVRGYAAFKEGRFTVGTNARQWLTRIATNIFINDYHKSKRTEVGIDTERIDSQAASSSDPTRFGQRPEQSLLSLVLDETIERALAGLTPDLRAAVLLVDVEGMEYADAAATLGTTQGTLRTRLSRARVRLHEMLADHVRLQGRP